MSLSDKNSDIAYTIFTTCCPFSFAFDPLLCKSLMDLIEVGLQGLCFESRLPHLNLLCAFLGANPAQRFYFLISNVQLRRLRYGEASLYQQNLIKILKPSPLLEA
jgi:hypothetical protein